MSNLYVLLTGPTTAPEALEIKTPGVGVDGEHGVRPLSQSERSRLTLAKQHAHKARPTSNSGKRTTNAGAKDPRGKRMSLSWAQWTGQDPTAELLGGGAQGIGSDSCTPSS